MLVKKIFKKFSFVLLVVLIILIVNIFPNNKKVNMLENKNINKGVVYLLDNNNYISMVDVVFTTKDKYEIVKEIIYILIDKDNNIRDGFYPLIYKNTNILTVDFNDDLVVVNFDTNFLKSNNISKTVQGLVYSLTSIKGINKVSILINGDYLNNYPKILDRSIDINAYSKSQSISNVSKVNIYYPAIYDEFLYYVPVSMYTDDKKEKIEIIIDELKSSSTYNSNFVSYLNYNTQLINYNFNDDILSLNFNNYILNDLNSSNITEEVKYAISLSVYDNYTINNVKYFVDDVLYDNYFFVLG